LAFAGYVDSAKGIKILLLWLQVIALVLSLCSSFLSQDSLEKPCSWLSRVFSGDVGICDCYSEANRLDKECLYRQSTYRIEFSVLLVFLLMLLLSVSGCSKSAAMSWPVMKFMALFVLSLIFMFIPNAFFSVVGQVMSVIAAGFAVIQAIYWVDFTMNWNDAWVRADSSWKPAGVSAWKWALLVFSAIFLGLGIGLCVHLCVAYDEGAWMAGPIVSIVVAVLLLLLSITEWCEVGTMVGSSAVVLYSQWLAWQALATGYPSCDSKTCGPPIWLSLVVFAGTMVILAVRDSWGGESTAPVSLELATRSARGGESSRDEESGDSIDSSSEAPLHHDAWDFSMQLLAHSFGATYITYVLAPSRGTATSVTIFVSLGVCLAIYGWILVAPKVLASRDFR